MKIERENIIKRIEFNNGLKFEMGEMNENEGSDWFAELCINIVKNKDNEYSICFFDNSEFYSAEFDEEGNEIDHLI